MQTAITVKRPRGRPPRTDAAPKSDVHARLPPALKARLECDAKRAHRSVAKEFELRLKESYVSDENYGGPQMAAMFREMAAAALRVESRKNRGSFFEDFETCVLVRDIWQRTIQSQMPRPADELLVEIGRNWDAVKAGAPLPTAQQAARELFQGSYAKSVSVSPIGNQAAGELIHGSYARSVSLSPIGNLAIVLEGLIPSQGSARAAAREVSRLAHLLAEMAEGEAAGETAAVP